MPNRINTWGLVKLFILEYLKAYGIGSYGFDRVHRAVDEITLIIEGLVSDLTK